MHYNTFSLRYLVVYNQNCYLAVSTIFSRSASSGRIQANGNEITMSIKSERKHGKANIEMIKKISDFFGGPENSIHLISGLTSRKKIIEIQNI